MPSEEIPDAEDPDGVAVGYDLRFGAGGFVSRYRPFGFGAAVGWSNPPIRMAGPEHAEDSRWPFAQATACRGGAEQAAAFQCGRSIQSGLSDYPA